MSTGTQRCTWTPRKATARLQAGRCADLGHTTHAPTRAAVTTNPMHGCHHHSNARLSPSIHTEWVCKKQKCACRRELSMFDISTAGSTILVQQSRCSARLSLLCMFEEGAELTASNRELHSGRATHGRGSVRGRGGLKSVRNSLHTPTQLLRCHLPTHPSSTDRTRSRSCCAIQIMMCNPG